MVIDRSPIHFAFASGSVRIVDLLIEQGANLSVLDVSSLSYIDVCLTFMEFMLG